MLVLCDSCSGKHSKRYLFQMKTRQCFFKFRWKFTIILLPPFYYQNFPDPLLTTGYLLRVVSILINASTWYLWSWKISDNEKDFRQISIKIERAANLRSTDTETSNFQVKLRILWKLSKIGNNQQNKIARLTACNSNVSFQLKPCRETCIYYV